MNDLPTEFVRAPEQPIETDLSIANGLFVKSYLVPKAMTYLPQHTHAYDHVTVVAAGSVQIWVNKAYRGQFVAPATFLVEAGQAHLFMTSANDTVLLCIHRVGADGEPEVIRENPIVPTEGSE